MTDNTKKISELGIATAVSGSDRVLMISLTNPSAPATRTATFQSVATFINGALTPANTTALGTVKTGNNVSISALGVISIPIANSTNAGVVALSNNFTINSTGFVSINTANSSAPGIMALSNNFTINSTGYLSLAANTERFLTQGQLTQQLVATYVSIDTFQNELSNYVTTTTLNGNYVNTSGQYTFSNVITFANNVFISNTIVAFKISANNSVGTNGQVLTSNGTRAYWSTIVPQSQVFGLKNDYTLSNTASAQSLFGVGVTLASGTRYKYKIIGTIFKTDSATNAIKYAVGGSATMSKHYYQVYYSDTDTISTPTSTIQMSANISSGFDTLRTITTTSADPRYYSIEIDGVVDVTFGGTFIPQIGFNVAPGDASLLYGGSSIEIYPVGGSGSNTIIGTWA